MAIFQLMSSNMSGRCISCSRTLHRCQRNVKARYLCASSVTKKDIDRGFPNAYVSSEVESGWYEWWEKNGYLSSDKSLAASKESNRKTFSMVFPPPNITGDLHLGHALTATIQDTLVRWHRARGFRTVWIPGYDHSGIATQVVIEKKVQAQSGRRRNSVDEKEFLLEARSWKEEKVATIRKQLKCLGPLFDWHHECYTLDENFSRGVSEAFVRLFDAGLICRRKSLVNWCCHLQSAISDIEVNNITVKGGSTLKIPSSSESVPVGRLAIFSYVLENSVENEKIPVATSRPETILGDVAVAVHPDDDRYFRFVGRHVRHPFDGRSLPVIADSRVSKSFGTGVVKITPAHDQLDFEIAETNNLTFRSIFDKAGNVVSEIDRFSGLNRFVARKEALQELGRLGLLVEVRDQEMTIPVCSRSGDIIEKMLHPQWYLDCDDMFSELTKDINDGEFRINPEASKSVLLEWLSHKRKWCISRQLWWGHRIPAYRLTDPNASVLNSDDDTWFVGRTPEEAASRASLKLKRPILLEHLTQDKDVLDTWFSSSLFPFVVFGWPNEKSLSNPFYPLSLMETGNDIVFFWVARMAILGKKLTGRRPFSNVLVHGLICDSHGRKMSKSLGNVIDPFDVVHGRSLQELQERTKRFFSEGYITKEELTVSTKGLLKNFPEGIPRCGADALRFALLSHDIKSQHINLDVDHVHNCSKFCNKIWQACKFHVKMVEECGTPPRPIHDVEKNLSNFDRWILSKLATMVDECDTGFRNHDFHLVTLALRNFWYSSFCDVYLEGVKPVVYGDNSLQINKEAVVSTLLICIRTGIVSLAPIMPFLAEELFHILKLHHSYKTDSFVPSVMSEPYPSPTDWQMWRDSIIEGAFQDVLHVVSELRAMRVAFNILKSQPEVRIRISDPTIKRNIEQFRPQLETLSKCRLISVTDDDVFYSGHVTRVLKNNGTISLNVQGLLNPTDIAAKLNQRLLKLRKDLEKKRAEMITPKYIKLSTPESLSKDTNMLSKFQEDIITLERSIEEITALLDDSSNKPS